MQNRALTKPFLATLMLLALTVMPFHPTFTAEHLDIETGCDISRARLHPATYFSPLWLCG